MTVRLVAIDLDGTLLIGDKQLPARGSQAIRQARAQGAHIVIATTRNEPFVRKICAALELDDPLICANGALIYSAPGGVFWKQSYIPVEVARRICQVADEQGWELSTSIGPLTYVRQRPGQALGRLTEYVEVVRTNQEAIVGPPHRILTWQLDAPQKLAALCRREFPGACHMEIFYKPDGEYESLGIFAHGTDKGHALKLVLAKMGIDPQQVMAIGDNGNDLPMFAVAAIKVSMGNATQAIKQAATDIAPSNEEEGVAWALEKYVLDRPAC